jgi:hypothetical protein
MRGRGGCGALIAGCVVLASMLGSCALDDTPRPSPITSPSDRTRTWVVPDGTVHTFEPSELRADDVFRCSDDSGGVAGVPSPGSAVGNSGGITVTTEEDGSVTVACEPGPPGNA